VVDELLTAVIIATVKHELEEQHIAAMVLPV